MFDQFAGGRICGGIAQGVVDPRFGAFVRILPRQGPPKPGAFLFAIPQPNAPADIVDLNPSPGAVTHFDPLPIGVRQGAEPMVDPDGLIALGAGRRHHAIDLRPAAGPGILLIKTLIAMHFDDENRSNIIETTKQLRI